MHRKTRTAMSPHTRGDRSLTYIYVPNLYKGIFNSISRGDEPPLEGGQIIQLNELTACVLDITAAVLSEKADLVEERESDGSSSSVTSVDVLVSEGETSDKEPAETEKSASSLNTETREKLGLKAKSDQSSDILLHPALVAEWMNWLRKGLYEEEEEDEKKRETEEFNLLEESMKKFPRKGTLLTEAQKLNPEILAYMSSTVRSRDKHFSSSQDVLGSAIIALARSISLILELEEGEATGSLLHLSGNAGKLLASLHYKQSMMRRTFILPGIDEKYRDLLKKSEVTEDLFGKDLFTRLKHTKSLGKVVEDLAPYQQAKKVLKNENEGNRRSLPGRYRSQPRQAQKQDL